VRGRFIGRDSLTTNYIKNDVSKVSCSKTNSAVAFVELEEVNSGYQTSDSGYYFKISNDSLLVVK
jgi:hypothetical protein